MKLYEYLENACRECKNFKKNLCIWGGMKIQNANKIALMYRVASSRELISLGNVFNYAADD